MSYKFENTKFDVEVVLVILGTIIFGVRNVHGGAVYCER